MVKDVRKAIGRVLAGVRSRKATMASRPAPRSKERDDAMKGIGDVTLLTPAPDARTQDLVEHVRYPNLTGDTVVSEAR